MAVAAISLAMIAAASYFMPCGYAQKITEHNWLVSYTYDGRMRIFWFDSQTHPFKIAHRWGTPRIHILPIDAAWPIPRRPNRNIMAAYIPQPQWQTWVNIGGYNEVSDFAFTWNTVFRTGVPGFTISRHSYVRFPLWIPALLLIITPIRSAIKGPIIQRRRKKRGECIHCGYNLTGNTTGVCPECGNEFRCQKCNYDLTGNTSGTCPECGTVCNDQNNE